MSERSPEYAKIPAHLTGKERERARRRMYYANRREVMLAKRAAYNRKRGHKSPEGPYRGVNVKKKVKVSPKRRYIIVGGEVFFSLTTGFTTGDLRAIIKEVVAARKALIA